MRFFRAVSSFVIGFVTGCLAAENATETDLKMQMGNSVSRLKVFIVAAITGFLDPRDPAKMVVVGSIGFFLGYEYGNQRRIAPELRLIR